MNLGRMSAVFRRHFYVFRHNPAGMLDFFLWPLVDMFIWGLLTAYLQKEAGLPIPVGFLLGAALLWTLMFRSGLEISVAFLDDTSWSGNIISLLVSPLRPVEYLAGSAAWGFTKIGVGWSLMTLIALVAFQFGIFGVGTEIVFFMLVLMLFGVALSLVVLGIVMRFGHGADVFAWGLAGIFTPLSAVWYPVAVMPGWAQGIASALPSARAFEGMRTALSGRAPDWGNLWIALGLDVMYVAAALAFAGAMFGVMRRRGFVTRYM